MAGGSELEGPDFTAGVALADIAEAGALVGHADGEAVMVVRRGDDVFAVGAHCSHYGGPLAEGLFDGRTVRCPWHHACFDFATGEALRPPALNDLAVWEVEQRDGQVFVVGKAASRTPKRRPARQPASVGIVGAGAAGNAAAETLRREGYEGPITLIDAEADSPYDRPNLSKDYLAGDAPEEWIPLHPPEFYASKEIDIVRADVEALDPETRSVTLADGRTLAFDALLLTTGAEPVRLRLQGEGARVLYLRSLADSRALIAAAEDAKQAVVIGASFIGLEAAASLRKRGLDVHVVAPESLPLARVMGDDLGAFVQRVHEQNGVQFHLEHTVEAASAGEVTLDDGTAIPADLVVVGVGVRPRTALAEAAGLTVDNGIVVNERLETSTPGIWAAGDVARFPDPDPKGGGNLRIEHWVVAERMGQTAARNILGARERFDAVPFFWSQHYDATIAYVGHAAKWDEAVLSGDPDARDCAVRFMKNGRRLALASIFRDTESLEAERAMERERA